MDALLIFARHPRPGFCKTRLIPALGAEGAALARSHGARVIHCGAGMARQMNIGAVAAKGNTLVFLHAGTRLPRGFAGEILAACAGAGRAGGAFKLRILAPGLAFRAIQAGAKFRSRFLRLPYGDRAIFAAAGAFHKAGGFPEQPVMEDAAFVRRVRRHGSFTILNSSVVTSARRWQRGGVIRTTALHLAAMTLFLLGTPADGIARAFQRLGRIPAGSETGASLKNDVKGA